MDPRCSRYSSAVRCSLSTCLSYSKKEQTSSLVRRLSRVFVYHDAKFVRPCVMVRRGLLLVRACEHADGTRTRSNIHRDLKPYTPTLPKRTLRQVVLYPKPSTIQIWQGFPLYNRIGPCRFFSFFVLAVLLTPSGPCC